MLRSCYEAVWSALFVSDIIAGERPTLFKRLTAKPRVASHTFDDGEGEPIAADLYRSSTATAERRAAIIVTHGFAHEGRHDPRLEALCRRLCRAGIVVVAPEFPEMRRYRLGFEDVSTFERCVRGVGQLEGVDPERVGVLGFSFGAAPILIGLSRESIRANVTFALIFGGYFDLHRTFKYVLTGAYTWEDHAGRAPLSPTERDDRWKFLHGNLHLLPPSDTRDSRFAELLRGRIDDPSADVDAAVAGCSEIERAAYRLMGNRDPAKFDELYEGVAEHFDSWVRALSPCRYADDIETKLLIAHSMTDPKTSYVESLAMSRGVPNAPRPYLALMDTFSHVDLQCDWSSLRSLWTRVIPGLGRLWGLGRELLTQLR